MPQTFTATKSVVLAASPQRVWEALTDPAQVKQYMFGADVVTDWKKGRPLIYRGMWKGQPFEDKGTILEIDPPRLLRTTYFSPLSGKPDVPENYVEVSYAVAIEGRGSKLTVTQANIQNAEGQSQAESNWGMVLDAIKTLIEG